MATLALLSITFAVAVFAQDEITLADCSGDQAHLIGWGVSFDGTHPINTTEGSNAVESWCYTFYYEPANSTVADSPCTGTPPGQAAPLVSLGAQFESCFRTPNGGLQSAIGAITPPPLYSGLDIDANMFTGDYWTQSSLVLPTPEKNLTICAEMNAQWPMALDSFKYLIKARNEYVIGKLPGPACYDRPQSSISLGGRISTVAAFTAAPEILTKTTMAITLTETAGAEVQTTMASMFSETAGAVEQTTMESTLAETESAGEQTTTDGAQITVAPSAIYAAPFASSDYFSHHVGLDFRVTSQQLPVSQNDGSNDDSSESGGMSTMAITGLSAAGACTALLLTGGLFWRRRHLAAKGKHEMESEEVLA